MTHGYGGRSSLAQGATSSNSILPRWSTIAHISGSRSGRVSNYSASSRLPPQRVLRFPSTSVSTRGPAPRRLPLRADSAANGLPNDKFCGGQHSNLLPPPGSRLRGAFCLLPVGPAHGLFGRVERVEVVRAIQ